ncbi:MAG: PAC2 family protein [Propionibacteriaceae bacterium]|nr:PAC2 family protein [Propionibacteriaceae bacterium]
MASSWRSLNHPIVVVAFSGWNDAADAASTVLDHLAAHYPCEPLYALDCEEFYDYQATRPIVERTPEGTSIAWPTIELTCAHLPHRDLVLVSGPEPNLRWPTLCHTLASAFKMMRPEVVVLLGAMLTDVPHTRPLPITGSSSDAALRTRLHLADPEYEGPTGIIGVLGEACLEAGRLRTITLWASVPHYAAATPNPRATLGLLGYLEDVLGDPVELGDLPAQARDWEKQVSELVDDDPELASYVAELEEQADEEEAQAGAGEALAAEFERYLRHIS